MSNNTFALVANTCSKALLTILIPIINSRLECALQQRIIYGIQTMSIPHQHSCITYPCLVCSPWSIFKNLTPSIVLSIQ